MELARIHEQYFYDKFPFPDFSKNIEAYSHYRSKGDLVTMGMIKKLYEAVFMTDLMQSSYIRAKGIKHVAGELERILRALDAEQVTCFVNQNDREFAMFLMKNFGFQIVKDIPLVKNL